MEEAIFIRNAVLEDLSKVVELENKIWPEGTRASREKFMSRLRIFPKGFFVAFKGSEMVGVSTSQTIHYDTEKPPVSWESITDNGWIEATHKSSGNALYVVSVGAISRSGAGSALVGAQKRLCSELNLAYLVLGARIPGYDLHCKANGEIPIERYVTLLREDNELLDQELRFYTRNGLRLHRVMPNYMEDDRESRNYGAIMIFERDAPLPYLMRQPGVEPG